MVFLPNCILILVSKETKFVSESGVWVATSFSLQIYRNHLV